MGGKLNIDWTGVDLGDRPDVVIAKEKGCSSSTVKRERVRQGIPACRDIPDRSGYKTDWKANEHQLGQKTDTDLARELGVSPATVSAVRKRRGIPPFVPPTIGDAINWDAVDLGDRNDPKIADELGVHPAIVAKARRARGIQGPRFFDHIEFEKEFGIKIGDAPDLEISKLSGYSKSAVTKRRKDLGIPAFEFSYVLECAPTRVVNYPEAIIDIYFHQKGIEHKAQVWIGRYRVDWVLTEGSEKTVIEYAGWSEHQEHGAAYRERLVRKLSYLESLGYKTKVLYKKDLKDYDLGIFPKYTGHLLLGGIDFSEQPELGLISDYKLATKLGVSPGVVFFARKKLGISALHPWTSTAAWESVDWSKANKVIAEQLGISRTTVAKYRKNHGIAVADPGFDPDFLGSDFDSHIAEQFGVSRSFVAYHRNKRGIPSFQKKNNNSE